VVVLVLALLTFDELVSIKIYLLIYLLTYWVLSFHMAAIVIFVRARSWLMLTTAYGCTKLPLNMFSFLGRITHVQQVDEAYR